MFECCIRIEIEDYGFQLGRHWGIGRAGRNDGALLIVAPAERRVRIEVGYGLEGTLTDAAAKVIIETHVLPRFRAGDMAGGIVAGADAVLALWRATRAQFRRRRRPTSRSRNGPSSSSSSPCSSAS